MGCGQSTKHYEITLNDYGVLHPDYKVAPVNMQTEIDQILLQARRHAAEDHKQNNGTKEQVMITYRPSFTTYPLGGKRFKIPPHRLGTYDIHRDINRAFIYHIEYAKETKRLQGFSSPRVIALGLLTCLAIGTVIAAETR